MDEVLAREAARLGYSDADEAVNLICELNIRAGQSSGYHFWLSLPVFAAIHDVRASLKGRRMEVAIRRHRDLPPLRATAVFWGPRVFAGEPPKHRVAIEKFSDNGGSEDVRTASASVRLVKVEEHDSVEVKLLHPDVGELHSFSSFSIRNLVPPPERNVLFEALKFFCPESELSLLLCSPHEKKGKRFKPDAAFELHVAWFFGLFGLSTVVLGEYEHIVAPKTKVRRGSVDILAASQRHKKLVLVACTIGTPKEEDFTNLLTTAEILAREVYADTNVRILPLFCTAAPGYPPYRDSGNGLRVCVKTHVVYQSQSSRWR